MKTKGQQPLVAKLELLARIYRGRLARAGSGFITRETILPGIAVRLRRPPLKSYTLFSSRGEHSQSPEGRVRLRANGAPQGTASSAGSDRAHPEAKKRTMPGPKKAPVKL
jgi:hypothetical protein